MPKFSIILPCYNVEKYLAKSIDSVLAQTFTDFELLVIIDGSPDNSREIAEDYAEKDNRIKVFEKPNGGLSDARNYGLERAIGEFIYFMDSDDWIEPNLLEDNLKIIEDEQLDFVVFGYIQDNEDANGNLISSQEVNPKVKAYTKGETDLTIDGYHLGLLGYAWNKLYRKSFLDQHQFRFEKGVSLVEDILFNSMVYTASNIIRFNQKAYYHYLNRVEETLMKRFYEDCFELKVQRNQAVDQFLTNWNTKNKDILLANSLFGGLKSCALSLNRNTLTKTEKIEHLKYMCEHPRSEKLFKKYAPSSLKDKILLFLIRSKSVRLIDFFMKLR